MSIEPTSDAHGVEDYLKLLRDFRAFPKTRPRQTFMEVSGYPHYENVCSNILRFYFDPAAEHGLKDLLLSAFLKMAGAREISIPKKISISREHPAEDQKRIDLVIDCETFTLGIENKIYHWEANDFENYARVIDQLGRNKVVVKAVLCLNTTKNQEQLRGEFIRYTYSQLWQQVRTMLDYYLPQADPKWVTCFHDFMESTANLTKPNMQLTKTDCFFIEHNEQIEEMLTERNAFLERLRQKLIALERLMQDTDEKKLLSRPPRVWTNSCVVLDFTFENLYAIAFDVCLSPKGWELQLFGRDNEQNRAYLAKLVNQPALKSRVANIPINSDRRFIVQAWDINADLFEIREALRIWMQALSDANKAI